AGHLEVPRIETNQRPFQAAVAVVVDAAVVSHRPCGVPRHIPQTGVARIPADAPLDDRYLGRHRTVRTGAVRGGARRHLGLLTIGLVRTRQPRPLEPRLLHHDGHTGHVAL